MGEGMPATGREDGITSLTVLGATGSVGRTTLALVRQHPGRFLIEALTAGSNWQDLAAAAREMRPRFVAIRDERTLPELRDALSDLPIEVAAGRSGLDEAARRPADRVVSAIVGIAGLGPTMAAVQRGATVAIANKEPLVSAGTLIIEEAVRCGATLLPVDSEHNAIFQVFEDENRDRIRSIVLTASGGPFLRHSIDEMAACTPEQALAHPNWSMGAKISIDSATMMNKGLEVIEAHHLFGFPERDIEVLVHPQSVVHGLVSYCDGSVLAHMAPTDMSCPIAHALAWPERIEVPRCRLDLATAGPLTFEPPDDARFPALGLARSALRAGGALPLVLNAVNEVAVQAFLDRAIGFRDIVRLIETMLAREQPATPGSLEEVQELDAGIRAVARGLLGGPDQAAGTVAMPSAAV